MKISKRIFIASDHYNYILSIVKGRVFHITSRLASSSIQNDMAIKPNKNGEYNINVGSEKSFGRLNNYICFFDFRLASEKEIEVAHKCYPFTRPPWFTVINQVVSSTEIDFYFLKANNYVDLIPNVAAKVACELGKIANYIPKVEVWLPGLCPLSNISEIVQVNIVTPHSPCLLQKAILCASIREKNDQP